MTAFVSPLACSAHTYCPSSTPSWVYGKTLGHKVLPGALTCQALQLWPTVYYCAGPVSLPTSLVNFLFQSPAPPKLPPGAQSSGIGDITVLFKETSKPFVRISKQAPPLSLSFPLL